MTDQDAHHEIPTSAIIVLSSLHGRERRRQRMIDKRDLQAAVKYGTKEKTFNQHGVVRYECRYQDIVYITDESCTKEITSWIQPGNGLDLPLKMISSQMKAIHHEAVRKIQKLNEWTSHTVIVVDQSGSMREADVGHDVSRSDAVWLNLALDFVSSKLESKTVSWTDVVSVISMGPEAQLLIDRKPHDWILYNEVVSLLRSQEPKFEGNYVPALKKAAHLLRSNSHGSCALGLLFLSDGRPSDRYMKNKKEDIAELVAALASQFGRRLTFTVTGVAGGETEFEVLKSMAHEAQLYGCQSVFACCSSSGVHALLHSTMSTLSRSVSETKTELTSDEGNSSLTVRNIIREPKISNFDLMELSPNWLETSDWTRTAVVKVHRQQWNVKEKTWRRIRFECQERTRFVALKKTYFGEGMERIVRKFREVCALGNFIGAPMVAKESRFNEQHGTEQEKMKFYRTFCDTQMRAQHYAEWFNKKLDALPNLRRDTPRVMFLPCSVYTVDEESVLVEKQLDVSEYKKWNNNKGWHQYIESIDRSKVKPFAIIEEEEEHSESDDDNDATPADAPLVVSEHDVAQAFSHFTYRASYRKKLVCDLQGVLTTSTDGTRFFEFTDPVIHSRDLRMSKARFGRTDHGRKGQESFFKNHQCSELCQALLKRRFVRHGSNDNASRTATSQSISSKCHSNFS